MRLCWSTLVIGCSWVLACNGENPPPREPCGETPSGCGTRQHCDRISEPNRCVCNEPYAGDGCTECAPGYRWSGSSCVPEPVRCADRPCGARGQCLSRTEGGQACVCETGYTGNFCASCVDGYQDNDGDGVCLPSCGVASVICQGVEVCSDDSGEARCVCVAGFSGPNCDECEPGYRREPSGEACVATCAAADFECEGTCIETLHGARCVCEPGYTGTDCKSCAETHSPNQAGSCVAPLPDDALLWTVARTERQSYLGALLPPDFAFFPVVPIADSVTDVTYDATSDTLYGVSSGALVSIDPQTGELTRLIESATGLGGSLTRDPRTGLFYVAADDAVWRADAVSGDVSELSTPGARSLTLDRARGMLLGITADGERVEIDPTDGARRTLGALPQPEALGLAVDAALGRTYVLAGAPEPPQSKLARFCADAAEGLGLPRAHREPSLDVGNPLDAGETRVLEDSGADPSLVAYGSVEGSSEGGTLRLETSHPEALVCVVTVREPLHIVVDDDARFQLLVVVSDEPGIELTVEESFSAPGATIHVRAGGDVVVSGPSERVTLYGDDEWQDLGLSTWSTAPDLREHTLGLIDWRSGSSSFIALSGPLELRGLSWVGVR